MKYIFLLLAQVFLFASDFDVIVVGSSPFSLFEALYNSQLGLRVLILEAAPECGGAWKGINVCGVPHVDLGCHQTGHNVQLKEFLEEYAGCKIVSLDNPLEPYEKANSPNGWYFSKGCFELIDHLLHLIDQTDITLYTNSKVEAVTIDKDAKTALVQTKSQTFSCDKLCVTPMSCFPVYPCSTPQTAGKSKYYHQYILTQDPTPPKFTYKEGIGNGISRLMNLTHFLDLSLSGRQMIVIQTHNEQNLMDPQAQIDRLKTLGLIDPGAYILDAESYIYETGSFYQNVISQIGAQEIVEVISTGHFQNLANYIAKWKPVLKPYEEMIHH